MNKLVAHSVLALAVLATVPVLPVFAQGSASQNSSQTSGVTAIYNALVAAKDPKAQQDAIAQLIQNGYDAATVISVAAAANISVDVVTAAVNVAKPGMASTAVVAAYNNGLNNIASFTPATAAGPGQQQAQQNQTAQSNTVSNGGFSGGSQSSSLGGGGGGSASPS